MAKQIGYGEYVFQTKRNHDDGKGNVVEKVHNQKRYYKVKKYTRDSENGEVLRVQIHRIDETQLASLKATPGVINMQHDVNSYFAAWQEKLVNNWRRKSEQMKLKQEMEKKKPGIKFGWFARLMIFIRKKIYNIKYGKIKIEKEGNDGTDKTRVPGENQDKA